MNYRWLGMVLLLLLLQAFVLWIGRANVPHEEPLVPLYMQGKVLDIAEEVEAFYSRFLPSEMFLQTEDSPEAGAASLRRETLLLRLRDVESRLQGKGVKSSISMDIETWISGSSHMTMKIDGQLNPYLQDLENWMLVVEKNGLGTSLKKLRIDPETRSVMPSLSIEAEGLPAEMGRLLITVPGRPGQWRLKEFDLLRMDSAQSWWMRGTFLFLENEN